MPVVPLLAAESQVLKLLLKMVVGQHIQKGNERLEAPNRLVWVSGWTKSISGHGKTGHVNHLLGQTLPCSSTYLLFVFISR